MKNMFILIFFISIIEVGAEINFFDKDINYWIQKKEKNKASKIQSKTKVKKDKNGFNWAKYKNVEDDEFFKEGNHIPPAPFMEVARRPTKENIKNWLEYISMKNKMQARFLKELRKYQKKKILPPESIRFLNAQSAKMTFVSDSLSDVNITTYFLTTCPACKKMFNTLSDLKRLGIYVEAVQIDYKKRLKHTVNVPVYLAKKEEAKGLIDAGIGVPYSILRIGKKAITLTGYQSSNGIMKKILDEKNKKGRK